MTAPRRLYQRLYQRLARALAKRRDAQAERGHRGQWFLLAGHCTRAAWSDPDPGALTPLYPPPDRFWADPFAWSEGGRHWVFMEEYPFDTAHGRISVLELGSSLAPLGPARPVIEEAHHLSYPFLFSHQGGLYMVPESSAARRVDLYHCTRFPGEWTRVGILLTDLQAADATLFAHGGRWWLFCSARLGKTRLNDSLYAFHADSPVSERWTPHAANPLVRDYAGARPAGRVFVDGQGRLLRPGQVSVPRYGQGLALHEVLELSPERYRERRLWQRTGAAAGGWRGLHHLDWHDGLMVMDAQRLIPNRHCPQMNATEVE